MIKSSSSPSVNLYKGRGKTFVDRFIAWALTFGRLIVIVTEIVAMAVFLHRFTLDRELLNLHDKIKQKQAIVSYSKANEAKYRNLQERLALAANYESSGQEVLKIFEDIIELAPKDFLFTNFVVSSEDVNISANVFFVSSLTDYVNKLRAYPKIQTVSLNKIENKTSSSTIAVTITATLKKNEQK